MSARVTSLHALPAALALLASHAAVAGPVVVTEMKVAQYREAADAARAQLAGSALVDLADAQVDAQLAQANVIVAVGQKSLTLAKSKAPNTPVVFCMVLGVGKSGLSDRVTGVPMEPDPARALAAIKAVNPGVARVGLIYNPAFSELYAAEATKAAGGLGLTVVTKAVGSAADVTGAAKSLAGSVDVLWLPPDPRLFPKEVFIFLLGFSAERSLPLVGFIDSFTQSGALMSVSADYADMGTRAGKLAHDIVAAPEGKRLPVPGVVWSAGTLTINLKTAAAFGVNVPAAAKSQAKQLFQ